MIEQTGATGTPANASARKTNTKWTPSEIVTKSKWLLQHFYFKWILHFGKILQKSKSLKKSGNLPRIQNLSSSMENSKQVNPIAANVNTQQTIDMKKSTNMINQMSLKMLKFRSIQQNLFDFVTFLKGLIIFILKKLLFSKTSLPFAYAK